MMPYRSEGIVCCTNCSEEMSGGSKVFVLDGFCYCRECFADMVGCDEDCAEYAAAENGATVWTAEDYLENTYVCRAELEWQIQYDERDY